MKIYVGSDHAGAPLRSRLTAHLRQSGHQLVDLGPPTDAPVDYPDYAAAVARAVAREPGTLGVLACGSGIGVSIAANKIHGIRAIAAWNLESATLSRAHNDTNVLCLGARLVADGDALAIADAWLATKFEGGRHATRVAKISALEAAEDADRMLATELALLQSRDVSRRIWAHDPQVFTVDAKKADSIKNRLGWLASPQTTMWEQLADIRAFVQAARGAGFQDAILLGMGGSSLAPEVLARTFGVGKDGLRLQVLDNTDPEAVAAIEASVDFDRTLFIVASKSGNTIEVKSFESHFWAKACQRHGGGAEAIAKAGAQFVAITDPDTELHRRATVRKFRKTFVNAADIGGRYSALSFFGLVPAALLGMDLTAFLTAAVHMATACGNNAVAQNPGALLGAQLGALAKAGRDKMTLVMSPEVASFGSWVEQLVAESIGKEGKGIVPVDLEPLATPALYGPDRIFVIISLAGATAPATADQLLALRAAGHAVIELGLNNKSDLGAEFYRWEFATAVAGASLGINPFDEPNVTEAKQATNELLDMRARSHDGRLPAAAASVSPSDAGALRNHLATLGAFDYCTLSAFFRSTPERERLLTDIRLRCREIGHVATTVGIGPRFLHSTGQLHKGGANTGVFIQLTGALSAGAKDIPIPNESFTFGTLRDAQAQGDFDVLRRHGRRALRVDLGGDIDGGLATLLKTLRGLA